MRGAGENGRGLGGRNRRHRLAGHVQWGRGRVGGLLFAQALQRGVGVDRGRVHRLRVAGDQPGGHALGEDVVEQALEHGGRKQLARAAHGRVPGQFLVHFIAQEIEDVQAQGAVLDQAAVADQVLEAAHQHQLEENDRVQGGLARAAVERPGLLVEKRPVHQLGQPAVPVMGGHPLREPKADRLLVEKQLLALHLPSTNPGSATATMAFRAFFSSVI